MPEPAGPRSPASTDLSWKSWARSGWIYPLLACCLLLLLLSAKRIGTYDLGTHLKAGQWILQHHAFPGKDTFTSTQQNRDYLDSNGLYQILLYLVQKTFGYPALSLLNMAILMLVFGLLLGRLKLHRASPALACLLWVTALLLMERRFLIRPEIFSWFYLSLTLLILDLRTRNRDFLFLLPLIQLLWVNTEGLFILGWFVMGVYLLNGWLPPKRKDPKLLRYTLLSIAADLLNPYFLKGMFFPFVLWTRLQGSNPHKQMISELYSPWSYLKTQKLEYDSNLHLFLFFFLAALCLFLIALTFRKRKWHEFLLLGAFGYLSFTSIRNIPLFALVAIPILSNCVNDYSDKKQWNFTAGKKTALLASLLIGLMSLRVLTNAFYISDRRLDRIGLDLDPERLPIKACEFLNRNHLDGRLLNHLDVGGWLDWKAPQPSFIDGRSEIMDDDFYREYIQSFRGSGLLPLVLQSQPQLILVEYNAAASWVEQIRSYPDWRLIYLDECAAIYAKDHYAPELPALSYPSLLAERQISHDNPESLTRELEKATPSKFDTWLAGFTGPRSYPMGLMSLGLFTLKAGDYSTALDFFLESLRRSGGGYDEIYFNLGVTNLHLKNYELGRLCLQNVLSLNPNNFQAIQMLDGLKPILDPANPSK